MKQTVFPVQWLLTRTAENSLRRVSFVVTRTKQPKHLALQNLKRKLAELKTMTNGSSVTKGLLAHGKVNVVK